MYIMNPANIQYVSSRNISEVGYLNGTLYVRFRRRNTLYAYYNVPERHYHGIITASSPTGYLNEYIKGHYTYEQIG